MSFIPNTAGKLSRVTGLNVFSEAQFSDPVTVECGVVELNLAAKVTNVRADSSASRGTIEEKVTVAKVLFLPGRAPVIGDRFELHGMMLRCLSEQPRISVLGILDHIECTFEIWPA